MREVNLCSFFHRVRSDIPVLLIRLIEIIMSLPPPQTSLKSTPIAIPPNASGIAQEEKEREREKKLAEQRSINALKLQRKQRLEALIRKRKANLQYLKVS